MTSSFRAFIFITIVGLALPNVFLSFFSQRLESRLLSLHFAIRGEQKTPASVTVVKIDRRSLRHFGLSVRQGFGFENLTLALERIAEAKPKLVVLDLYMPQLSASDDVNRRLRLALSRVPTVIARGITSYIDTDIQGVKRLELERNLPAKEFSESAAETVLLMLSTSQDEVAAGIHLASTNSDKPLDRIPLLEPLHKFVSPDIQTPDENSLINYYGLNAIPSVPVYKLVTPEENLSDEYFRDRVVFVGGVGLPDSNPNGGDDSFKTPLSESKMYGVEVHATITQNLLDGTWLRRYDLQWEGGVQIVLAGLYCMALSILGVRRSLVIWGLATAVWAGASWYLFSFQLIFIPGATLFGVVLPLITGAFALTTLLSGLRESDTLAPRIEQGA